MGAPFGNKNAVRAKKWSAAVERALDLRVSLQKPALDDVANKLIDMALSGDIQAIKELGDRLDGKAKQQLTVDGDGEGGPVKIEKIVREVVRANP